MRNWPKKDARRKLDCGIVAFAAHGFFWQHLLAGRLCAWLAVFIVCPLRLPIVFPRWSSTHWSRSIMSDNCSWGFILLLLLLFFSWLSRFAFVSSWDWTRFFVRVPQLRTCIFRMQSKYIRISYLQQHVAAFFVCFAALSVSLWRCKIKLLTCHV